MHPIIHQTALDDLEPNPRNAKISLGDLAELRVETNGAVAVYVVRPSRLPFGWGKPSYLRAGNLDCKAKNIILPALKRRAHLRVRVVQVDVAHLSRKKINSLSISVWGNLDHLAPTSGKNTILTSSGINGPMPNEESTNPGASGTGA